MSNASARFASVLLTITSGAVLGVGAFTLGPGTERWLAFGVGCAVLTAVGLAFLAPRRGAVQRLLDLPTVLTGAWLVVCSRAIESAGAGGSGHAVKWFNLAAGAVLCGAGIVGLLLHEFELERDLERVADESWAVRAMRNQARASRSGSGDGAHASMITEQEYADAISRSAG
ncbi:MAG TPA: hypothetical protein VHV75_04225 [Solirubrobacteraceae bacterium]|jgi:hypothetical protein|nr:hypothetical protein [Solirubrobacteraceae bacterium]